MIVHRVKGVVTGTLQTRDTKAVLTREQLRFMLSFMPNNREYMFSYERNDLLVVKREPEELQDGNKRRQHMRAEIDEKHSTRKITVLKFIGE